MRGRNTSLDLLPLFGGLMCYKCDKVTEIIFLCSAFTEELYKSHLEEDAVLQSVLLVTLKN